MKAHDFGPPDTVNPLEDAAQLGGEPARIFAFIQVCFHFEVNIHGSHCPDDTIKAMQRAKCHLCETRPPRRACPALGRDICAVCCGEHREESVDCPLDCPHLREARRHEKPPARDPQTLPHPDIEVTERFLAENEHLVVLAGRLLVVAALQTPGAVDSDLRDALESLARTYRSASSGLIYESRPANRIAESIVERFQKEMADFRERVAERTGVHSIRDQDLLGALVFWQRMEWQGNNGRRKGRAFIDSLVSLLPPPPQQENLVTA